MINAFQDVNGSRSFMRARLGYHRLSSTFFGIVRGENNVVLSVGLVEQAENGGGTLFCTTVLIGKDGELLHKHRKV
jgi:predicted amidohydrolase